MALAVIDWSLSTEFQILSQDDARGISCERRGAEESFYPSVVPWFFLVIIIPLMLHTRLSFIRTES